MFLWRFFLLLFYSSCKSSREIQEFYRFKTTLSQDADIKYVSAKGTTSIRQIWFYLKSNKKDTIQLSKNVSNYLNEKELEKVSNLKEGDTIIFSLLSTSKDDKYPISKGIATNKFNYTTEIRMNFGDYYMLTLAILFFLSPIWRLYSEGNKKKCTK